MALRVLESEAVERAGLPLAELAARLGQPTGWDTAPEAVLRLEHRLHAALAVVEARLGLVLLRRRVVFGGTAEGGERVALPRRPVAALESVEVDRGDGFAAEAGARLVDSAVLLPRPLRDGWPVRVTVEAGHGAWADLPAELREAVLLDCEAGEANEKGSRRFRAEMDRLLAGQRWLRIGGGR